jgi:hypothetical protein
LECSVVTNALSGDNVGVGNSVVVKERLLDNMQSEAMVAALLIRWVDLELRLVAPTSCCDASSFGRKLAPSFQKRQESMVLQEENFSLHGKKIASGIVPHPSAQSLVVSLAN